MVSACSLPASLRDERPANTPQETGICSIAARMTWMKRRRSSIPATCGKKPPTLDVPLRLAGEGWKRSDDTIHPWSRTQDCRRPADRRHRRGDSAGLAVERPVHPAPSFPDITFPISPRRLGEWPPLAWVEPGKLHPQIEPLVTCENRKLFSPRPERVRGCDDAGDVLARGARCLGGVAQGEAGGDDWFCAVFRGGVCAEEPSGRQTAL